MGWMLRGVRDIIGLAGSSHFSRCYAMENHDRHSAWIAVSNLLALRALCRLTDFPSVRRNELRKDAGGCREVPAGARISENSGVTRHAHPSAGTGRHGHGDWMETDRCGSVVHDLLIPDARSVSGQVENAACKCVDTCDQSTVWPAWPRRSSRPADRSPMSVTEVHDVD